MSGRRKSTTQWLSESPGNKILSPLQKMPFILPYTTSLNSKPILFNLKCLNTHSITAKVSSSKISRKKLMDILQTKNYTRLAMGDCILKARSWFWWPPAFMSPLSSLLPLPWFQFFFVSSWVLILPSLVSISCTKEAIRAFQNTRGLIILQPTSWMCLEATRTIGK